MNEPVKSLEAELRQAEQQRDEWLAACSVLCHLLDKHEIEIPSSILKLKFAEPGLFKAAIANMEEG